MSTVTSAINQPTSPLRSSDNMEFQSTTYVKESHGQPELPAQFVRAVSDWIAHADAELRQIEDPAVLGQAIARGCHELANVAAHCATQLDAHFEESVKNGNDANEYYRSQLALHEEALVDCASSSHQDTEHATDLTLDTPNGVHTAAVDLLRDCELALRAISTDDADELAATVLVLAHTVLRMAHQLLPIDDELVENQPLAEHPQIERVEESDARSAQTTRASSRAMMEPPRLRCLWPPVGPQVQNAIHWTKSEFRNQPLLLQASLAATLWPAAVATACFAAPALLTDHVLQKSYDALDDHTPAVAAVELAAGHAYESAHLCYLTARMAAKPTLRVAHAQWERHAPHLVDSILEKASRPVETAQEAGQGAAWLWGHAVAFVQQHILKQQPAERLQL